MSQKKTVSSGQKAFEIIMTVLCCIIAFVFLVLLGARAYFRLPVSEYYAYSEQAFVIPGVNDGMIHQGLAYDSENDTFLITGYRTGGNASQVSVVSCASGNELKRVNLAKADGKAFTGHVGGITHYGDYIYVADSKGLYVYAKADFEAAKSGDSVKSVGMFKTTTDDDKLRVSFTHVEGDTLYIGEFHRDPDYATPASHKYTTAAGDKHGGLILAYKLDRAETETFGIVNNVERAYTIPDLVQGMCFDASGKIYLSTSYGATFSHIYSYTTDKQEGNITVLGQSVPLYVLDSSTLVGDIKLAPMAEEIVIVDGKLYTMCEAATNKYIFGKFTSAKYCYATDISKFQGK